MVSRPAIADWAGTKGVLGLRSDSFISSDYEATSFKTINFVKIGVRTSGIQDSSSALSTLDSGLQLDIDSQFSPELPATSYLNIRQLYHQEGAISVGRKIENWSPFDSIWHLGLYEPQFRGKPLEPETQGLTGIFVHLDGNYEGAPVRLALFGSVISIPDQNVNYSFKDGKLSSENPWYPFLPTSIKNSRTGAVDTISYELEQPNTNSVLFNSSFISQLSIGLPDQGSYARVGYAYKPAAQLSLGADGAAANDEKIDIKATVAIFYHRLFSMDYQFRGESTAVGFGLINEKPENPKFEKQWTYQNYEESNLASAFAEMTFGRFQSRLRGIHIVGADESIVGPKESFVADYLPHRFPYKSAAAIDMNFRGYWKKFEGIKTRVTYLQGLDADYSELIAGLDYQLDSRWTMGGQITLVQANVKDSIASKTIFSQYENNDSALVGMTYVF